jgi:hypothetical protein
MRLRLLYWIPTALTALLALAGGLGDALRTQSALEVFHHLGYPDYFSSTALPAPAPA